MIEHYAIYETNVLTDRFGLTGGVPKGVKPRYNVSPAQGAPVIVASEGMNELQMMLWGLVSNGAKDANSVFRYKTFNVPSEKVFGKSSWDTAVRSQRCIIPVNGFYMIRAGTDEAYYFTASDNTMLAVAGIYTRWTKPDGETQLTFAMLTIESNDAMPLPFGRMPCLLHPGDEASWIDPSMNDYSTLVRCMRPYEGAPLVYRKVLPEVSSVKIDHPRLMDTEGTR